MSDVLSEEVISRHGLLNNSRIAIIKGKDFDPGLFNYHGKISTSKDYVMYLIVPSVNRRKTIRLFQCRHENDDGNCCGETLQGIKNFF